MGLGVGVGLAVGVDVGVGVDTEVGLGRVSFTDEGADSLEQPTRANCKEYYADAQPTYDRFGHLVIRP